MATLAEKVKAQREALGLSQPQLGKAAGLTYQAIQQIEGGTSKSTRRLLPLAKALKVTPEWLADEDAGPTPPGKRKSVKTAATDDDFVQIGRFDASFSMGPGSLVPDHPEPMGYWLLETQWLNVLTRTGPADLAIVRADGDSMAPTLRGGDWVLIDKKQTRLTREGIYALRVGNDVWIKRLSLNLREKLVRIISDNPAIPHQDVDETDLTVIGKVILIVARKVD